MKSFKFPKANVTIDVFVIDTNKAHAASQHQGTAKMIKSSLRPARKLQSLNIKQLVVNTAEIESQCKSHCPEQMKAESWLHGQLCGETKQPKSIPRG